MAPFKLNKTTIFSLIATLFVLSGVAALIYQVVWFKYLSYFLGNTSYSQAIVLATFMGGLAIGSWWWGKKADQSKNPLKLFAWLEILIAVYCFFYAPIFELIKEGFIHLVISQGWESDSNTVLILKLIVSGLTILIPTILMGGTLPVLVRYLSDRIKDVGKNVAILYFINSLGAVIGTLWAGFYLLQAIGLQATVYVGASMDLLVGVVFLIIAFKNKTTSPIESSSVKHKSRTPKPSIDINISPIQLKIALLIAGISGLCAMIYEVAWLRLLIPILNSSTYSFTLILTVFISGITLGSLLMYFLFPKLKKPFLFLGICQLGIVLSIMLTLPFYEKIPYYIWSAIGDNLKSDEGYQTFLNTQFQYAFMVMIIPTIFMGMSLPLATKLAVKRLSKSGESVGKIFAINTIGTVIGSLLAGLILIPFIGIRKTMEFAMVLNLVLAGAVILLPHISSFKTKVILALTLILCSIFYFIKIDDESWAYSIMTSNISREINRKKPPATYEKFITKQRNFGEILYYNEGISGTIVVGKRKEKEEVYLYTNGKGDANSVSDLRTQVSLGQTPLILHSSPDTVLVIGYGAGTTIGSVLTHSRVNYAEVAEISPEVIEASKHFEHVNQKPLEDERLRVIKDDGVSALRLSPYRYDIIISQPSNPWSAGVGNLFTKEFFSDCKRKLKPGGYVAQWFNLYEMDDKTLRLIIRTALSEFDYISVWHIGNSDILLLCSETPFHFDLKELEQNFLSVSDKLSEVNIETFPVFLSQEFIGNPKLLTQYSARGEYNTENLPLLEYWSPKAYFLNATPSEFKDLDERINYDNSQLLLKKYEDSIGLSHDDLLEIGLFQSSKGNKKFGFSLANQNPMIYIAWAKRERLKKDYKKAHEYLDLSLMVTDTLSKAFEEKANIETDKGNLENAIKYISKAIEINPQVQYYLQRSEFYKTANNIEGAIRDLEQVIVLDPKQIGAYINIGNLLGKSGNYREAIAVLDKAEKINRNNDKIFFNRGYAKALLKDFENAIEDFNQAIEINPDYHQAIFLRGRCHSELGNFDKACDDWSLAANKGSKSAREFFVNSCQ